MRRGARHAESFDQTLARLEAATGTSQFTRPLQAAPAAVAAPPAILTPSPLAAGAALKRSILGIERYRQATRDAELIRSTAYLHCWEAFR